MKIEDLQDLSWKWQEVYNPNHPHQSLNNQSTIKYLELIQVFESKLYQV
jgi:transposase InsO family protein